MGLKIIDFLKRESNHKKGLGYRIIFESAVAGTANAIVVIIISRVTQDFMDLNFRYLALFCVCITIFVVGKRDTLYQMAIITGDAISNAHIRIADKIRRCKLLKFEEIGDARIYTTLSDNSEIIFEASRRMSSSASSAVMLFFSFFYIAYLSMTAFWFSVIMICSASIIYLLNQSTILKEFHSYSKHESEYNDSLKHFLSGFKEIKMDNRKSNDILENYLKRISKTSRTMKIGIESRFISNFIFAQIFFYILLGAIVFLLPQVSNITPEVIVQVTAVILFVIGPLGEIVELIPLLTRANMAVDKIEDLELVLEKADDSQFTLDEAPLFSHESINKIELKRLSFIYPEANGQQAFKVGPVDLTINRGELTFIVGGNGSGKTTFLKLLTGLYYPTEGSVFVNDVVINTTNYSHYRALISIIFSDFHLFDRLYGLQDVDNRKINDLLNSMEISEKTTYADGKFTNTNLSTGQRKRLAMCIALMDDKPVYVFDEVAADQDPDFRRRFYEVILTDMKKSGKTIIAATHDDKYFHVADRVLKMDYGKLRENHIL